MKRRTALISTPLLPLTWSLWKNYEVVKNSLPDGLTILFQGDSITDAGRHRGAYYANNASGMGHGYASYASKFLLGSMPDKNIKCYNRGISGHKVHQLADRWEEDCLNLKPDVLSILIGVNDYWHTLTNGYSGDLNRYRTDYDGLLDRTKSVLPEVKLIMCEPFVLKNGTAINEDDWLPMFDEYRAASRELCQKYGGTFVPFQSIFSDALGSADTAYWCPDGVHPSMAGSYLMAEAWLKAFSKLFN